MPLRDYTDTRTDRVRQLMVRLLGAHDDLDRLSDGRQSGLLHELQAAVDELEELGEQAREAEQPQEPHVAPVDGCNCGACYRARLADAARRQEH